MSIVKRRYNKLKHISHIKLADIYWIKSLSGNAIVIIRTQEPHYLIRPAGTTFEEELVWCGIDFCCGV